MLGIIIDSISTFMYSKLLVILLIGAGIYFTIRTKLPQMRLFKDACKAVVEKPEDENGVSSFQALMVSTASRVGTGNIIWSIVRYLHWRIWLCILDVDHCDHRKCIRTDRKYAGTDL